MKENVRVMVVEDDFMVADINRQATEQVEGFSVVKLALNGKAALEELASGRIDLVILDVYLPDVHGLEVLKEARRLEYSVDFILITAAQDTRTVEQAMRYGIIDYLIKPFDFARYRSALAEYRDRRSALGFSGYMNQSRVDTLLVHTPSTNDGGPLPKGISKLTLETIKGYLAKNPGEVLAVDIAAGTALSRVTARRYLEYLAETGVLRKEIRYQKVGRPLVFYSKA
jgi:two-component system, CitB family, response regulator DctR